MPTTTPFDNLITFSRGSNATVTGSNGLIQWAPNNLLTFSEQFDNAAWVKANFGVASVPTVTANFGTAPDGSVTADRVQLALNGGNTTTARALVSQSVAIAASVPYTFSIWLRSLSGSVSMGIGCDNVAGNTPVTVTPTWQRFTLTGTSTGSPALAWFQLRGGLTPTQSDTADILVWGAQLEIGSTVTTYNPTTVKNLLGFSEAFSDANWTKVGASFVTGAQANPANGLFNAQKLMENTANSQHYVAVTVTAPSAPMTLSVYAKAAGRSWLTLYLGAANTSAYFNLDTGALGTVQSGVTASIINVGGGWYRCAITALSGVGGALTRGIYAANADNSNSYTGDGNSGVYIYGAQLSDSASLDPYVPTPGAAPSSTAFYGPRFDFDPVTRAPRGLLVEEQRTNLLLQSEAFGTTWLVSNATISSNVATSPDGTSNADKLIDNANPAQHFVYQSAVKAASSITYTLTSYMKSAEYTRSRLFLHDGAGNGFQADYNLATGTAGAAVATGAGWSAGSSAITAVGNGWYRCVIIATSNTAVSVESRINVLDAAGNANFTGTGTSGIFLYGAQLEAGAFATSYIPTVASTVTRSADVATISGQNFAQWYAGGQGTFVFEGNWQKPSSGQVYVLANGSSNRYIYDGNSATLTMTGQSFDGTNVLVSNVNVNGTTKIGSSYQTAINKAISVNGSTTVTGAYDATAWSTNTALRFGEASFSGYIRNIRFIPARVADFQLQALTELPLVPTLDLDFLNNLYEA